MATTNAAALPVIALLLPIAWLACWTAAHQRGVVVTPDGVLASTSSWLHYAAPTFPPAADAAPSSSRLQPGGGTLSLLDLHSIYALLLALLLADLWRHASARAGGCAAAGSSTSSSATQQQLTAAPQRLQWWQPRQRQRQRQSSLCCCPLSARMVAAASAALLRTLLQSHPLAGRRVLCPCTCRAPWQLPAPRSPAQLLQCMRQQQQVQGQRQPALLAAASTIRTTTSSSACR
jgi:hypothetical protein